MPATKRSSKNTRATTREQDDSHNQHTTFSVENSYGTLRLRAGNLLSRAALIGVLGWGVNSFSNNWAHKTQVVTSGQLMHNVDMASTRAVRAVEQTFAQPLRQSNAKLPAQYHAQAKRLAMQHLKASLGPKGMRALRKAVGGNLDALLEGTVEAALYDLKHSWLLGNSMASTGAR